jgi:hypothetical protein
VLGAAAVLLAATGLAQAQQVGSDTAAGILVFPKISVDTTGLLTGGATLTDTVVEIANTDPAGPHQLHCFWVNANSFCAGDDSTIDNICDPNSADPELNCRSQNQSCVGLWRVTDFFATVTQNQPVGFRASQGGVLPCGAGNLNGCSGNEGALLPVPEDPFVGELKCVEIDNTTDVPVDRNDFIGTARIYDVTAGGVDVRQYNAVGIPAITGSNNSDQTLCLGTDGNGSAPVCSTAEYASCPSTLVLNHFFEGAEPFGDGDAVNTTLTLVPCSEDLEDTSGANSISGQRATIAQLAIINEFEQRFSSSTRVDCFKTIRLSDLDTRVGTTDDSASIFAVGVEGTLTGQTRIRGVPANSPLHGLLGVAEETYASGFSDAFNLNYDSVRPVDAGDVITLPALP